MKFIKEILGVHCKASNVGCRSELNRIPLKSKVIFSILNFFKHIHDSNNTLLKEIFINSKECNPWYKKIKQLLNDLGLSYLINSTFISKGNLSQIKQRIQDQCIQNQYATISKSSKLDFFRSIFKKGERPPYVDILKNKIDRAAICKIRISAHPLYIEQLRYKKKDDEIIPKNERFCPLCKSGQIEDENHFILDCDIYKNQRDSFNNKILNITLDNINFSRYNKDNKVKFLLNNNSYKILKLTSSFIIDCLKIRKELMLI